MNTCSGALYWSYGLWNKQLQQLTGCFLFFFSLPSTASNLWSNFKRASERGAERILLKKAERKECRRRVTSSAALQAKASLTSIQDELCVLILQLSIHARDPAGIEKKKKRIGDHQKTVNCRTGICNSAGLVSEMWGHTLESGVLLFQNLLNASFFCISVKPRKEARRKVLESGSSSDSVTRLVLKDNVMHADRDRMIRIWFVHFNIWKNVKEPNK